MLVSILKTLICFSLPPLWFALPCSASLQTISDRIVSEHVRMLVPMEREWLGRDVIMDLERCWRYVNSLTAGSLPRKILVEVVWDGGATKVDSEGRILIGMRTPAADFDMRSFLLRSATRETARLGLLGLSRGTPVRGENALLLEGMSEIIAREFFRTTRTLAGAWVQAQMLDRMSPLSVAALSSAALSDEAYDLRAEAPGITFLLTCSALHGRDRTLKLFDALRRGSSLEESIAVTFKTTAPALEAAWLKKVRAYTIAESLQASQDEDTPKLERVTCVPAPGAAGSRLQLRLFMRKGANVLLPGGLYFYDEAAGKVYPARTPAEKSAEYSLIEMPVEAAKVSAPFSYRVIAIDEGGSVSDWQGSCSPGR